MLTQSSDVYGCYQGYGLSHLQDHMARDIERTQHGCLLTAERQGMDLLVRLNKRSSIH